MLAILVGGLGLNLALLLPAAAACTGDCDGDGHIAVNELIVAVSITLGRLPMQRCDAIDRGRDGHAGIDDLIQAVAAAVTQCSEPPTPTVAPPSPTASATDTASPTSAPTATVTSTITSTITRTTGPTRTPTPTRTASVTGTVTPTMARQFRDVAFSTQAAMRLATSSFDRLATMYEASLLAQDATCPGGGSATVGCEPSAEGGIRTTVFDHCLSSTTQGHSLERNGIVRRTVGACKGVAELASEPFRIEMEGFRLEERAGIEPVASALVDAVVQISPAGEGCAGLDSDDRFDGRMSVTCTAAAEALRCPAAEADFTLEATDLLQARVSTGTPCEERSTANGTMSVEDHRSAERYAQIFTDFAIGLVRDEIADGEGDVVSIDGAMNVECLGRIQLSTVRPLRMLHGSACPVDGELRLGRSDGSTTGSTARQAMAGLRSAPLEIPGGGFRQFLFRALDGKVYQVIQNEDAANGADVLRLTTLVGSLGDSVALCTNTAGSETNPRAAAVVSRGTAFPLEGVLRSPVVPDSALPCFNRNAVDGRGRVCIGAGCSADCGCADEGSCSAFTLDDGMPLGEGEPPADLVAVSTTCGSFPMPEAYSFGASQPTIEQELCAAPPNDGIELPFGSTLIVAYDTLPLELFNTGAAGFPIDVGEGGGLCPAGGVLSPGRAVSDTAAAPRIEFTASQDALAYYDTGPEVDQKLPGCETGIQIRCAEPPNPTPTPTVDPERPCGASVLDSQAEIDLSGSTAERPNTAGEAGCGWGGGNRAPDQVFEYVAPASGTYHAEVETTAFTPYLYVRDGSCLRERAELGCGEDAQGEGKATLDVRLAQGQRIAIVVDGASEESGDFRLRMTCKPDLAVSAITVAQPAVAGDRVAASVEVVNQGGCDSGPFGVELAYARDEEEDEPVSLAPARCEVGSLAAGGNAVCVMADGIDVPLVAGGSYFAVARVDPENVVDEQDEQNNTTASSSEITPAAGAVLRQRVFRAADGTTYHLIQAVPQPSPTSEGSFRVTTLAASLGEVTSCATSEQTLGAPLRAAAGSTALLELGQIRRTGILRPNNAATLVFEDQDSGRLVFGSGRGVMRVCADAEQCGNAASLGSLSAAGGGIPAACVATAPGGSYCPEQTTPAVFAFGVPHVGDLCSSSAAGQIGIESQVCANSQTFPGGFTLASGEVVVFVSQPGPEAVGLGVGALGVARAGLSVCAAGQLVSARAFAERQERVPFLSLVEIQDAFPTTAVAIAPDGKHLYAGSFNGVTAMSRGDDGGLTPLEVEPLNLDLAPQSIVVSPDGQNVYAGVPGIFNIGTIAVFSRQQATGQIELVERTGSLAGGLIAMSPDGRHIYGAGNSIVTTFARDATTGTLRSVEFQSVITDEGQFFLMAIAVSGDGKHVYLVSTQSYAVLERDVASGKLSFVEVRRYATRCVGRGIGSVVTDLDAERVYVANPCEDTLTRFARNPATGTLSFVEAARDGMGGVDGLEGARSMISSPDGLNLYVASPLDGALAVFEREAGGALHFLEAERGGLDDLEALASIAISPDGRHLYVPSAYKIAIFARQSTGALDFIEAADKRPGADALAGARSVAVSADGQHLYLASSLSLDGSAGGTIAAFSRDDSTGALSYVELLRDGADGVEGLGGADAVAVSPDGMHVYVASAGDDAVAAFAREADTGALHFVEAERDGVGGVNGLDSARSIAVSPDGKNLYVAGPGDDAVAAFARDAASGALQFVEAERDGVGGVDGLDSAASVAVSGDGLYVYATGAPDDKVAVFARNVATGALAFIEGESRAIDDPRSLAASPDGKNLYVANAADNTVAVFGLRASGALRYEESLPAMVGTPDSPIRLITVSPEGKYVYVSGTLGTTVYSRSGATGLLTLVDDVGRLLAVDPESISVSPDGRQVYFAGSDGLKVARVRDE